VGLVLTPLAAIHLSSVAAVVYYGMAGSLMMSLLGLIGGLWADKFDHLAAVTNFVVTPLTFLSGTFYSVSQLPEAWRLVAHLNPFFYMIDGFRYGFTGAAEGSLVAGVTVMGLLDLLLLAWCHRLFVTGYKLKA
ncbi:MAG: ABC transporter permease, partial [Stellaceae bacterium]